MLFTSPPSPSIRLKTPLTTRVSDKLMKEIAETITKQANTPDNLIKELKEKFKVPFRNVDKDEADSEKKLRKIIKTIINNILKLEDNKLIQKLINTIETTEINWISDQKGLPCIDVLNVIFYDPENSSNMLRRPLTKGKLNKFLSSSSTTPDQGKYDLRKRRKLE